jgi:hypothetical protein
MNNDKFDKILPKFHHIFITFFNFKCEFKSFIHGLIDQIY